MLIHILYAFLVFIIFNISKYNNFIIYITPKQQKMCLGLKMYYCVAKISFLIV